jgi:hypothetical protein
MRRTVVRRQPLVPDATELTCAEPRYVVTLTSRNGCSWHDALSGRSKVQTKPSRIRAGQQSTAATLTHCCAVSGYLPRSVSCANVQLMHEQLPAPLRELLALYAEKYADLQFPGLDLAVLESAARQVEQSVAKVVQAQAEVDILFEGVRAAELELTQKAARALSFLKVYVEGDESEYARLDALTQALLARPRVRRPGDSSAGASAERVRVRGRSAKSRTNPSTGEGGFEVTPSCVATAEAELRSSASTTLECVAE